MLPEFRLDVDVGSAQVFRAHTDQRHDRLAVERDYVAIAFGQPRQRQALVVHRGVGRQIVLHHPVFGHAERVQDQRASRNTTPSPRSSWSCQRSVIGFAGGGSSRWPRWVASTTRHLINVAAHCSRSAIADRHAPSRPAPHPRVNGHHGWRVDVRHGGAARASAIGDDGSLCTPAGVEVLHAGKRTAYRALHVQGAELERVALRYAVPFVVRVLTGFPPREFLRLDPR